MDVYEASVGRTVGRLFKMASAGPVRYRLQSWGWDPIGL